MKRYYVYCLMCIMVLIAGTRNGYAEIRYFEKQQEETMETLQDMLKVQAKEEAERAYPDERVRTVTLLDTEGEGGMYTVYIIVHMTGDITVDLWLTGNITYDARKEGYWIEYRGVRDADYRKDGYRDKPPGIWQIGRGKL